jgi:hypothetical protein
VERVGGCYSVILGCWGRLKLGLEFENPMTFIIDFHFIMSASGLGP